MQTYGAKFVYIESEEDDSSIEFCCSEDGWCSLESIADDGKITRFIIGSAQDTFDWLAACQDLILELGQDFTKLEPDESEPPELEDA